MDYIDPYRRADRCKSWSNPKTAANIRFLIMTLGPTGSGKSSMAQKLKEYATQINSTAVRYDWQTKVLDEYVEESPEYRTKMDLIIEKLSNLYGGIPELKNKLDDLDGCSINDEPWSSFAKECSDAYFEVRSTKTNGKNKVDLFNDTFHTSLQEGKNIIFEITGRNMLTTIEAMNAITAYTNDCENFNYIILAGYNITDYYSLQTRNIQRFTQALKQYLEDSSSKPPRLPWVGCFNTDNKTMGFCIALSDIKNNIKHLIETCGRYQNGTQLEKYSSEECLYDDTIQSNMTNSRPDFNANGLSIDILFIFNNIYRNIKLILKIPISERSALLGNLSKNVYPSREDIDTTLQILDFYGPIEKDKEFLDVCNEGIPHFNKNDEVLIPNNVEATFAEGKRRTRKRRNRKRRTHKSRTRKSRKH